MQITKLLFGEIALKKQLVTREQVEECLEIQKRLKEMGISKTLGAIMHDKKYLSMVEIKEILREMTGQKEWNAIEGYEILGKLGKGGMGSVYKARHTRLDKTVALKVLPPELAGDQEYLDRFLREAHAAAKLNHPNIVQALDVGESYGYHYFVMEYVKGVTVKELIDRHGTLPERTSLEIVAQIASALDHAWKNDIVHRDIKPSNIIIAEGNVAKLCDLGLAKTVDDDATITQTGVIMGTPFYLSPEQARSEPLDCRSDIYSLGVTLFHMLTGQVPFTGNSAATILYKHIFLDPPNPKSLNPSLHDDTVALVRRMLAKRKEDRHDDPKQLRDELLGLLERLPASAGSPSAAAIALAPSPGSESNVASELAVTQDAPAATAAQRTGPTSEELECTAGAAADALAEIRRGIEERARARPAHPALRRARWIAAAASAFGLLVAAGLLAGNLALGGKPSQAEAQADPVSLLATTRPRPEILEVVERARRAAHAGRFLEAARALEHLAPQPAATATELRLVLATHHDLVEQLRKRVEQLEARHAKGETITTELENLQLEAVADRLRAVRSWLEAQTPSETSTD